MPLTSPILPGTVFESITVAAPIAAVFAALSEAGPRSTWSKLPGRDTTYSLDFRPGGWELRTAVFPNIERDERLDVRVQFIEIVEPTRVVASSELRLDGVLRTTSITAWELAEVDGATLVSFTEQYLVLTPTGDGTADQRERTGATPMMLRRFKITVEERA
jgi:uncharacterized protein YndB with AHSA1/START domain